MMRFLTCSNSCPRWEDGRLLPRSPGGLAPMLVDVLGRHGGEWVFTAPPGVTSAEEIRLDAGIGLHPVPLDDRLRAQHYDEISIGVFLGIFHHLHDASVAPLFDDATVAAWEGYETVNRIYADRLGGLLHGSGDETVLLNDPHLMLLPEMLDGHAGRRRTPLAFFLGTPWPEPGYFGLLPGVVRRRVLESLLCCDTVGFHSPRWVDAFADCCLAALPDARRDGDAIEHRGRRTRLVAAPFPLDTTTLDAMVDEQATARWATHLAGLADGRRTLVRADRLDLWKNVLRGFGAYEVALEQDPDLARTAWFAAVLTTPSRATDRHLRYQQRVDEVVDRINARFGRDGRDAVSVLRPPHEGSRNCVVAALRGARAALVNSTADGLNVFAKEAAWLMPDDATLLLSPTTGVHDQLGPVSVEVDPYDLHQTAAAIRGALAADSSGRGLQGPRRRDALRDESIAGWWEQVFGPPRDVRRTAWTPPAGRTA